MVSMKLEEFVGSRVRGLEFRAKGEIRLRLIFV